MDFPQSSARSARMHKVQKRTTLVVVVGRIPEFNLVAARIVSFKLCLEPAVLLKESLDLDQPLLHGIKHKLAQESV